MELDGIVDKMAQKVKKNVKTIVLPETEDARVLKAASIVSNDDIAKIILIGDEKEIRKMCIEENIDMPFSKIEIINNITSPKKEYYDNQPLLVYCKGNSQKLASLRITMDDISSDFTLENYEEIEVPNTGVGMSSMFIFSFIIFAAGILIRVKSN